MVRPIARFTIDPQQERAQRVAQRYQVLLARGRGLSPAEAGRSEGLAGNKVGFMGAPFRRAGP